MAKKLKAERRDKKKKQKMIVSGKSVFALAEIIGHKTKKQSA
jgi:hypothetical protein